jgi:hypothetical protein
MLKKFLIAWLLGLAVVLPAGATSVLPLNLDEMIAGAAVAFEGTCVGNRTERDPTTNLVVTYTTFSVRESLKGDTGATHVIKQVGGQMSDGTASFEIQGVPKFVPGEDYVVFLAGVSAQGFSSPFGLAQGRFDVKRGATGGKVSNGRDFRDMTSNFSPNELPRSLLQKKQSDAATELDLDEFKQLVRKRVGSSLARPAK